MDAQEGSRGNNLTGPQAMIRALGAVETHPPSVLTLVSTSSSESDIESTTVAFTMLLHCFGSKMHF